MPSRLVILAFACAVLLALAPAAGGAKLVVGSALDPSASGSLVAYATKGGDVVVRPSSGPNVRYDNASEPALSGEYLAYVDAQGIRVVRWGGGNEVARIADAFLPALDWPNLAYVVRGSNGRRLIVRNLVNGQTKRPARVPTSSPATACASPPSASTGIRCGGSNCSSTFCASLLTNPSRALCPDGVRSGAR